MDNEKVTALETKISSANSSKEKVEAMNELAFEIRNSDTKRCIALSKESQQIAQQINDDDGYATALNNEAFCYVQITDYELALEKLYKSLSIFEETKNEKGIAQVNYNLGLVYLRFSDLSNALDCVTKSLSYYQKTSNTEEMARCLFQVGYLYYSLNDFSSAIEYYRRGIVLSRETGNKATEATSVMGLGMLYSATKEYDKSSEYLLESMRIREAINDRRGYAAALNAYMTLCLETGKYEEAKEISIKGIKLATELGDKMGISRFMLDLGKIHLKQNNIDKAEKIILEALETADKINLKMAIVPAHFSLAELYESKGNFEKALHHYRQFHEVKEEMQSISAVMKAKSIQLVAKIENAQQEAEINRLKNVELKNAFDEIEEKNREILQSITYAKRIQTAILPPSRIVKEYLKNSFVLYIPKDIVAGDFYWMESVDNKIYFAACDCTGHGVPGAMVSVVCNNALNRALNEFGERLPGKILDKTRELVLENFAKSDEEVKDGMDTSLAVLNVETRKLLWAGANNPLWIIKQIDNEQLTIDKDNYQLIEIKPDKQPIGHSENPKPFTTHTIKLNKGDCFYIFTDGYQDQFGGEKGRKFMAAKMKELLLSIHTKPMEEQKKTLQYTIESWKGNLEQVDDICVIGVRV